MSFLCYHTYAYAQLSQETGSLSCGRTVGLKSIKTTCLSLFISKQGGRLSWHPSDIEQRSDDESHFEPAFEAHRCAEKSLIIMSVYHRQYILGRMDDTLRWNPSTC